MVFISYSHVDTKRLTDLLTMAAPFVKFGGMRTFSDADIGTGASWRSNILRALDQSSVAVLLVSPYFFNSAFIRDVELPRILKARQDRGLRVVWVVVSHCAYEVTPLAQIQAALPPETPLEDMPEPKRKAALKALCFKIADAMKAAETPRLDPALKGRKVPRKAEDLKILAQPATRRTEIFIRADNSADWYHQGPVLPGKLTCTCYFGTDKTAPNTGFHIKALTTDLPVPPQGGKPTKPLPKSRTQSEEVRVVRG